MWSCRPGKNRNVCSCCKFYNNDIHPVLQLLAAFALGALRIFYRVLLCIFPARHWSMPPPQLSVALLPMLFSCGASESGVVCAM